MRLGDFLAEPRLPYDFVRSDCCRWVDLWCQRRGHGSPMAAIGIVYDSERSAMRRIAEGGGLVTLWTGAMALLGVPEVDEPACGNVGVIECDIEDGRPSEVAAIHTGERWASLGLHGLVFAPAPALRVWRV